LISTNDLRPGIIVDLDGTLYLIVTAQHVKPGKGSAFVRVKMKKLSDGSTIEQTFRAGEKVQRLIWKQSKCSIYILTASICFHGYGYL